MLDVYIHIYQISTLVDWSIQCPLITGETATKIRCVANKPVDWKEHAQSKEDLINQINANEVTYTDLGSGVNIEECALKCTNEANTQQTPGCCEYRSDGEGCFWTTDESYLAPEFRNLGNDSKNEYNTKAVLCSKGNET